MGFIVWGLIVGEFGILIPKGLKQEKPYHCIEYIDMAPCKANFNRSIHRSRFKASLLNPCVGSLLTRVHAFCNLHLPLGWCHFQKCGPKNFFGLDTNNLKIVSTSSNQKKPVKCFLFIFSNLEANILASVSFVNN